MKRKTTDLSSNSSINNSPNTSPAKNSNNENKNGNGTINNNNSNSIITQHETNYHNLNNFYQQLQQIRQDQQHVDPELATRFIQNLANMPMQQIQHQHQHHQSTTLLTPCSASGSLNIFGKNEVQSHSMLPINTNQMNSNYLSSNNTPISLVTFNSNNSFLSKSLPSLSSISQANSQNQLNLDNSIKSKQSPTVFNFPSPAVPISSIPSYSGTLLTPSSSPQLNRDESSIPLKKRAFNDANQIQFLSNSSPPVLSLGLSYESFLKTNRIDPEETPSSTSLVQLSSETNTAIQGLNLSDWLKHRVLAICSSNILNEVNLFSNANIHNKRSSSTSIEYSLHNNNTREEIDYEEANFVHYYLASIQKIDGTFVTVKFESNDPNSLSRSYSVPSTSSSLNDSLDTSRSLNPNQQTYDISKEGQKYSLIEDAAPLVEHLEKGVYVLYRCQNQIQQLISHPSTPTPSTPTSPINSNLNASNSSTASNCSEFKYRLGKIVDIKEKKKYFLVQPISLDTKNNYLNSLGSSQPLDNLKDLTKLQLVTRPNLRLLSPPWYSENKLELELKSYKDINLQIMFPKINQFSSISTSLSNSLPPASFKKFDTKSQKNTNNMIIINNNINTQDSIFKNQFPSIGPNIYDAKNSSQLNEKFNLNQEFQKLANPNLFTNNKLFSDEKVETLEKSTKTKMNKILHLTTSNQGNILIFIFNQRNIRRV